MELAVGQLGACALTFWEFRACEDPEFFWKDPISNRSWIEDMESAYHTSLCPKGRSGLHPVFCRIKLVTDGRRPAMLREQRPSRL